MIVKPLKFGIGLGLGAIAGWMTAQQIWAWYQVSSKDVQQTLADHVNQAAKGLQFEETKETEAYTIIHRIEDGIERISYIPKYRRYQTPIIFQHGMWHGAWCWDLWQGLLAEWGWESHAHSLPGHANSDRQRNIPCCTLDYYLGFLKAEIDRFPEKPIVVGHSMGGALTQWYLKYVGDLSALPWPNVAPTSSNCTRAVRFGLLYSTATNLVTFVSNNLDKYHFILGEAAPIINNRLGKRAAEA
jgi:pimeloyl-ACP methyl ester carboxylesterase